MGCDIHCYIEYKKPDSESGWRDFGGRINPGRNYLLFGALAGVRTDLPHIKPRGFAPEMASEAFGDCTIYVSKLVTGKFEEVYDSVHYSRAYAEECIAAGYCQWLSRFAEDESPSFVTNSDYHSHSWLSSDEFELAIACYLKHAGFQLTALRLPGPQEALALEVSNSQEDFDKGHYLNAITEYWPILHAMRCFEAQGHQSRLVFWFDN